VKLELKLMFAQSGGMRKHGLQSPDKPGLPDALAGGFLSGTFY